MRISDWSSDVCSSDLFLQDRHPHEGGDPVTLDADDRAQATSMDSRLRGNDEEARFAVAVAPLDDGFALDAEAAGGIPFAILTERHLFRSDERRVGKECVRTCTSRCSPHP